MSHRFLWGLGQVILQANRDAIWSVSVHQTSHIFFQPDELCCGHLGKNRSNKSILNLQMLTERQHLIIQNVKINMLVHVRGHCREWAQVIISHL
ncbi:hypothetical protein AVEN_24875-1 [Araneus ventricosus]|uniref:Uncharacterized protein n=1 Tax=Araneus ventricosus TaxID=182803 RepID=A0A4Y2JNS9_ARAVE|nr:hypothetical protein AVEN_24875-1 [Araneus ventricosus]